MAQEKVFFDIQMNGADKTIKELHTIENELKKVAAAKRKDGDATGELKKQEVILRAEKKRLNAEINKSVREFNANKNAVKAAAGSYDQLVERNKALVAQMRRLPDPLGKNKKAVAKLTKEVNDNTNKLKKMDEQMGRNHRNVGDYSGAIGKAGKQLLKYGAAIAAAIAAAAKFISFAKESIDLFDKQRQAEVSLEVALGRTSQALIEQAQALQQTTRFGDEATIQGQAFLAQMGLEEEAILKLTPAILDMAQAKGMDLRSAFDLVAKSVGSSTNALSRYGIQITGVAGSTGRVDSAIAALNEKFSGQAEAATAGAGKLIQFSNAVGDLQESIGEIIVGGLEPFLDIGMSFITLLDSMLDSRENYAEFDGDLETTEEMTLTLEEQRKKLDELITSQEAYIKSIEKFGHQSAITQEGLEKEIELQTEIIKIDKKAQEEKEEQTKTLRELKEAVSELQTQRLDAIIGSKLELKIIEQLTEAKAELAKAEGKLTEAEKEDEKNHKEALKDLEKLLDFDAQRNEQKRRDSTKTSEDIINDMESEVEALQEKLTKEIGLTKQSNEEFLKEEDVRIQAEKALDQQIGNEKVALAQQTQDAIAGVLADSIKRRGEAEIEALEKQKEQGLISEEAFERKSFEIKRRGFRKLQAMKLAEIASNLASELSAIATNAALNPANALTGGGAGLAQYGVLQGMAVARAAINAATILAQKFEKGGLVGGGVFEGNSHAQGGVKFASGGRVMEAEGGEAIINKRSTSMYKPLLSAINQAGGGKKFAFGGITPDAQLQTNAISESGLGAEIARQMGEIRVINVVSDTTSKQISINNVESEALF